MRKRSYSGGSSIDVKITECPFRVLNPAQVIRNHENPHVYVPEYHCPRYTTEATALAKALTEIMGAYNHDGSDTMSDYFDVKFYGHVTFASDIENTERVEIIEEHKANEGWTLPE